MDFDTQLQQQQQQQQYILSQQQPQDYQSQQQQQQASSQLYDPSSQNPQTYEYDPSAQAYYPGYAQSSYPQPGVSQPQYQPQQQQQQQQPYPYYPPEYAAAAYQQPVQPDPSNVQSIPLDATQMGASAAVPVLPNVQGQNPYYPPEQHVQPQQNAYYPQEQQAGYDVPLGLNPAAAAAVAALSQLTQFAGKMDAAERAMAMQERQHWQAGNGAFGQMPPGQHPVPHGAVNFRHPGGRPPYRGGGPGGRRGGGRVRGGRSNFDNRRPRQEGGGPSFRGRGHMGRGGGRRFSQSFQPSPYSESAPTLEQESAMAPAPASTQPPQRQKRPPQVAWCDLCRVDCNTQDVLEQHKNGKRHKKNLERIEQFQKYEKRSSETQPKVTQQLENGQGGEENKASESLPEASASANQPDVSSLENIPKASSLENLQSAMTADADDNKMETGQQIQIGEQPTISKVEEPTVPLGRKRWGEGRFEDRRHAPKWKLKFGWGGKRFKNFHVAGSSETPKEQPKYCALCDVMCDTQAVFECHLAGKKHASRVQQEGQHPFQKKQEGQHDNFNSMDHTPLMPHTEPASSIPQDPPVADQAVTESQAQQYLRLDGQNVFSEPKGPQDAQGEDKTVSMEKVTGLENSSTGVEHEFQIAKDVSLPDYGMSSSDRVILPGLDIKVDESFTSAE